MKDFNARLKALVCVSSKMLAAHTILCDLALPDAAATVREAGVAIEREIGKLVVGAGKTAEVVS